MQAMAELKTLKTTIITTEAITVKALIEECS
jgi:hypothetical protein